MERRHAQLLPHRKFPAASTSQVRIGGKAGRCTSRTLLAATLTLLCLSSSLTLSPDDTMQAYEALGDAHIDPGFSV